MSSRRTWSAKKRDIGTSSTVAILSSTSMEGDTRPLSMRDIIDRDTPAWVASAPADRSAARRWARIWTPTLIEVVLRFGGAESCLRALRGGLCFCSVGNGEAICFLGISRTFL